MTAIRNGGIYIMEKKNIDWGSIGFGYIPTDYRYVANFKDGKWDEGELTQAAYHLRAVHGIPEGHVVWR